MMRALCLGIVLAFVGLPVRLVADDEEKPRALTDILVVDAEIKGDWRENKTGGVGDWSLKITKRDGNKFEGRFRITGNKGELDVTHDVEGKIGGNNIVWSTANTVKVAATVKGRRIKDELRLDYQTSAGTQSKMIAPNVK